ncbi:MAG: response regulator [Planctomycetes bacterium]|nr:response regulator [Planctomycetota bacterium]
MAARVVLLDIMLPGVNGYETCRRIRATPELRDCKVILVSAEAMTSERLRVYEVGADDYVTKPFHAGELHAKVRVFGRLHSVEALDRMKDDLLSILAHELRTPLTGTCPWARSCRARSRSPTNSVGMWGNMVLQNGRRLIDFVERGLPLCACRVGSGRSSGPPSICPSVLPPGHPCGRPGGAARLQPGCRAAADPGDHRWRVVRRGGRWHGRRGADAGRNGRGSHGGADVAALGVRGQVVVRGACSAVGFRDALVGLGVRQAGGEIVGADIGLALARTIAVELGGEVTAARHDDGFQFAMTLATAADACSPSRPHMSHAPR